MPILSRLSRAQHPARGPLSRATPSLRVCKPVCQFQFQFILLSTNKIIWACVPFFLLKKNKKESLLDFGAFILSELKTSFLKGPW